MLRTMIHIPHDIFELLILMMMVSLVRILLNHYPLKRQNSLIAISQFSLRRMHLPKNLDEYADWAMVLGIFALLLVPLWIVKYPAIVDFPNHLTRVAIARNIGKPGFDFAMYYRFTWHPTYLYFDLITYIFSFIFGLFIAAKMALSLYILLFVAATRYLLKSIKAPLLPFIFWPALLTYNWWFWIGSINLLAGFCIGMFAMGFAWKNRESSLNPRFIAILLLLILFSASCHPFCALLTCAMVIPILFSFVTRKPLRWLLMGGFIIAVVCFEILLHVLYHQPWEPFTNLDRVRWMLHGFYAPASEARIMKVCLFAAFCIWCFYKKNALKSYFMPFLLIVLIMITPHSISISGDNDMRCAMFLFFIVPCIVPSPQSKFWRSVLAIIILGCACYWNFLQVQKQQAAQPIYNEIERIASILSAAPIIRPVINFSGRAVDEASIYITFYRGGFTPFLFESSLHGLAYLKRPNCTAIETWERVEQSCAGFYNFLVLPTYEPARPEVGENDLAAMGFVRQFSGKYFNCYAKRTAMVQK